MSASERKSPDGYSTTRTERLRALERRLLWLDAKLLDPVKTAGNGLPFLRAEREATYWAIETLGALIECHDLRYAIGVEQRRRAETQQDAEVKA